MTITVNSVPEGATVYYEGKNVGVTPCNVTITNYKKWVYDIDLVEVLDPNIPPYSFKFTFVLEGYEPATEYFEGMYEYHASGIYGQNKYYLVKPKGSSVMAFLKKDSSYIPEQTKDANSQGGNITNPSQEKGVDEEDTQMQYNIDSDPEDARVFWRILSNNPTIKSTEQQYLGKTPFKDKKPFRIIGLTEENTDNVNVEIVVKKSGYQDAIQLCPASEVLSLQEINGFFELKEKTVPKAKQSIDDSIINIFIDSAPNDAEVFWRLISLDPSVQGTEQQYLGKTPYKEQKTFKINGLSTNNADKVKLELIIKKNGYYPETKLYSVLEMFNIRELNGYFEMQFKE